MSKKDNSVLIGSDKEIFFNKESKSSTFEITYDSTNDVVTLHYFNDEDDGCDIITMSKKEYVELKGFLKSLKLAKNYKLK